AYKVTGGGSSGYTIAIVDAYGYANAERDLSVYRAQYGLPPCTTANGCFKKVNQTGAASSYPRADTGWAQEQALDLDMRARCARTARSCSSRARTAISTISP